MKAWRAVSLHKTHLAQPAVATQTNVNPFKHLPLFAPSAAITYLLVTYTPPFPPVYPSSITLPLTTTPSTSSSTPSTVHPNSTCAGTTPRASISPKAAHSSPISPRPLLYSSNAPYTTPLSLNTNPFASSLAQYGAAVASASW